MSISDWSSDVCSSDLLHNQLPSQFRNRQKWVSGSSNFIGFARFAGRISNHCPNIGQRVSGLARHFAASQEFSGENRANGPSCETGVCLFDGETRSEENTSELQSLMRIPYAGFCLKKKKTNK